MKAVIIMVAIVVIIFALNTYAGSYIDSSAKKMLTNLEEIKKAVQSSDVNTANSEIKKLRDQWEGVESHWEILVDHREIDRIDTLMTHLEAMGSSNSLDTIMPELEELSFFFTHIDDKHKIKAENIL